MATFNNIDGEEPATVTFRVGTIQISRGTTAEQQEILCLGDPETSAGIARVSSVAPASTDAALYVRLVSGPSSVNDLSVRAILPSTGADNPVSAIQGSTVWQVQVSSMAGRALVDQNSSNWQVQPGSTAYVKTAGFTVDSSNYLFMRWGSTVAENAVRAVLSSTQADNLVSVIGTLSQVSSLSTGHITVDTGSIGVSSVTSISSLSTGHVTVDTGSIQVSAFAAGAALGQVSSLSTGHVTVDTGSIRVVQSTASELTVRAQLHDSTNNAIETSTFAASTRTSTVRGLMVRQAVPDCTSATVRLATAGDNSILSSATTTIHVYALTFAAALPTTGPSTGSSGVLMQIQAGTTGARLWSFNYQYSSLMTAQNSVAVTPPAYLFRTGAGNSLNAAAGATGGYVSVAAWRE